MDDTTPAKAKKLVGEELAKAGIPYERLQARTVNILGERPVFVKPIGMALPDSRVATVKKALPRGVFLDLPDVCPPGTVVK